MNGMLRHLEHGKEWIILALMFVVGAVLTNGLFLQPANLTDMLRAIAPIAIMAMAMTLVILTAGIDLSVGSTLALTSVSSAMILTGWNPGSTFLHLTCVVLSALVIGGLAGLVQGALIARLNIHPRRHDRDPWIGQVVVTEQPDRFGRGS